MPYRLQREAHVTRDLERIYNFLFDSYVSFGDQPDDADRAAHERVMQIENAMETLVAVPHQGVLRSEMMPGLRSVTKDRAVFYFTVDENARVVRVLAVFFGGQDHHRLMLMRLGEAG